MHEKGFQMRSSSSAQNSVFRGALPRLRVTGNHSRLSEDLGRSLRFDTRDIQQLSSLQQHHSANGGIWRSVRVCQRQAKATL
jgi:hypothetical protein